MYTSRLAEQHARLVVMLRRGDLPEELQNEKIVELHLQNKQVCVTMTIFLLESFIEDLMFVLACFEWTEKVEKHSVCPGTKNFESKPSLVHS